MKRILLGIMALAVLGIGSALAWALMDTMIHATGDHAFCSSCHSHAPIGASYEEDVHGGNNRVGWRATCSQCHIPQDNSLHYLWVKGLHGVVDPVMEMIKEPHDIDWHGNRERRNEYVYDSGCLSCTSDARREHQIIRQVDNGHHVVTVRINCYDSESNANNSTPAFS